MNLNWLDIILIVILLITLVLGLLKGLVRQIIGILALIAGVIFALIYYGLPSAFFVRLGMSPNLSYFLGFLTVFFAVLLFGWLVAMLLSKLMRGPFKFFNHILGGAFGLLKGILLCGVIVFAMLVFPVNTKALKKSRLAPYCIQGTRAFIRLIPSDLREKFTEAYKEIGGKRRRDVKRV